MLLYLSKDTFVGPAGDRLAEEVRALRAAKLPVLLLHEKTSCEFNTFFQTTPQDLIAGGLYKMVALELLPGPHRDVSAVHLGRALGAHQSRRRGRTGGDRMEALRAQRLRAQSRKMLPRPLSSARSILSRYKGAIAPVTPQQEAEACSPPSAAMKTRVSLE